MQAAQLRTTWLAVLAAAVLAPAVAVADQWTVPVTITNGGEVSQELILGIDPAGTYGVDIALGEVGLPPWPPTSVFDARFMIDGLEGLHLDIRDDTPTERVHEIQWQAGAGGSPVILRWDGAGLPAATFTMRDGYTGSLIPDFDMAQTDSLVIPSSQSFIKRIDIVVLPGEVPPAPPQITPALSDVSIFAGQRFPEIALDDHVHDPDHTDADLTWIVTGDNPPWITISPERILSIEVPAGWTGSRTFHLRVVDPGGLEDEQDFTTTVIPGGLPAWEFGLTVTNSAAEQDAITLGLHPDATAQIDPDFGEIALPPWPPAAVFEGRFLLPDDLTHSVRDIRESIDGSVEFHLQWQAGDGGYPVTVGWPATLPAGEFAIRDDVDGTFLPPLDMASVQSLTVPGSLSFITGLIVSAAPDVDATPPVGPAGLDVAAWIPGVSVTLDWSAYPCAEENFAYYEILYDEAWFTDTATLSWDWSEDPNLSLLATTATTIQLPATPLGFIFRIRAWDTSGNAGSLSGYCYVDSPAEVTGRRSPAAGLEAHGNLPNPFNPQTVIEFSLAAAAEVEVQVVDVRGRLVNRLWNGFLAAGRQRVLWNGRDGAGREVPSGTYFCCIRAAGQQETLKMLLLK